MWGVVAADFLQVVDHRRSASRSPRGGRQPSGRRAGLVDRWPRRSSREGMGTRAIFLITPFLFSISVSYDAFIRYQSAKSASDREVGLHPLRASSSSSSASAPRSSAPSAGRRFPTSSQRQGAHARRDDDAVAGAGRRRGVGAAGGRDVHGQRAADLDGRVLLARLLQHGAQPERGDSRTCRGPRSMPGWRWRCRWCWAWSWPFARGASSTPSSSSTTRTWGACWCRCSAGCCGRAAPRRAPTRRCGWAAPSAWRRSWSACRARCRAWSTSTSRCSWRSRRRR